jgi:8-oxo-dGTP pyrophosphatase MutT (NUDIX family)
MTEQRRELVDICVRRSDGKFLAVTNRRYDGWTLPGGKIDEDEIPSHAAIRELAEETGLKVTMDSLFYVGVFEHRWRGVPTRCYGYTVSEYGWDGQEPTNVEAGTRVFWVDRDDLLDPTSECLAHAYYGWLMAKKDW